MRGTGDAKLQVLSSEHCSFFCIRLDKARKIELLQERLLLARVDLENLDFGEILEIVCSNKQSSVPASEVEVIESGDARRKILEALGVDVALPEDDDEDFKV